MSLSAPADYAFSETEKMQKDSRDTETNTAVSAADAVSLSLTQIASGRQAASQSN